MAFLSLGTVWLTLPTFYSPVALSMCRSSRGNVLVRGPGPSLPGLASGCSHYPLASPPPHKHPPASTKSHDSWPGCCSLLIQLHAPYPHTLAFITLIPHSYVVEEQCLFCDAVCIWVLTCHVTLCVNVLTSVILFSSVWCPRETEQFTQAVLCSLVALQPNMCHAHNFTHMPKPWGHMMV